MSQNDKTDSSNTLPENRARYFKLKSESFFRQVELMKRRITPTKLLELNEDELQIQLEFVDKSQKAFDLAHDSLEELDFDEIGSELRDKFDESIAVVKAAINSEIRKRANATLHSSTMHQIGHNGVSSNAINISSKSRLPELKLPTFSGGYTEWADFYSVFNTIVGNDSDLSKIVKFQHLRSCLKDAALDTIRSLEISESNYDIALSMLEKRFDKKRLIFQAHIREILGLKKVEPDSVVKLRELSDKVNAHMRALQSMSERKQIADFILIQTLLQKLDSATQAKWEETSSFDTIPSWDSFSTFLEQRCQTLENVAHAMADYTSCNQVGKNNKTKNTNQTKRSLVVANTTYTNCVFCGSASHVIYNCSSFANLSPSARLKEAKRLVLCLNCLKKGHQVRACKSGACRSCNSKHHTLLHFNNTAVEAVQAPSISQLVAPDSTSSQQASMLTTSLAPVSLTAQNLKSDVVLLATAIILVKNRFGMFTSCRALLDSGSQLNFITSRLANKLQIRKIKSSAFVSGIGDTPFATEGFTVNLFIQSNSSEYSTSITALVASKITDNHPSSTFDIASWNLPKNISLADPKFHESQRIDLLIGASLFFDLLCVGQIRLLPGLPLLQKTRLGWIVSGALQHSPNLSALAAYRSLPLNDETIVRIDELVRRFWEVENCVEPIVKASKEEIDCEAHFVKHFFRLPTGEYSVRLPLKLDVKMLGSSYQQALRRFLNLERKLSRRPELKEQYSAFIKEYLELKHMSPVNSESISCCKYFLPHHCVIKEGSTTTKLRVVFDGSAPTSSGYSLNDLLMSGPTIQPKLFNILIRFRMFPIAVTGDICKMYRCVRISPPDNFMQCILWRDSLEDDIQVYKLDTVTYGTKPASFLAIRTMHQLASDEAESFPIAAQIVKRDFYVDDLITGGSSREEALQIMSQTAKLLEKGHFKLRKWCSNDPAVLNGVHDVDKETLLKFDDGSDITKALGLVWNPSCDNFLFSFSPSQSSLKPSKRAVLSTIARFYDPIGLLGPVTTKAKVFLQRLWREKLDWDESLPSVLSTAWSNICDDIHNVKLFEFPRFVLQPKACIEVHGFCDASIEAYGACIYVRSCTSQESCCHLLCSKSRVAPLKTLTVPKLELCAAKLLSHLIYEVSKMKLFDCKYYCWSDSSVTLSWIREEPSKFNVFVSNRVATIQQLTCGMNWRYVPTSLNPADVLSRGALPSELRTSSLWFHGPSFLSTDKSYWPESRFDKISEIPEVRKKALLVTPLHVDMTTSCKFLNNFNSMQRIFAYVYKFIKRIKSPRLTVSDINGGKKLLLRHVQQVTLWDEYKSLKANLPVKSSSRLISLSPFMDSFGLLRVGGRLENSDLCYEARHPIILPNRHPVTQAVIKQFHEKNLHAGPSSLLSSIRMQFWIIGGRKTVSQIINKCVRCFRAKPRLVEHIMADLPKERVEAARAFIVTGVDYCGPFFYKPEARNKQPVKCYVSIFICFATKAVHFELVKDLSTSSFLDALKRFIFTRGRPKCIWSDNATNFVGAKNELLELRRLFFSNEHQSAVHQYCLNDNIDWKFIPPRSPHFGGLWEAAVKTAKYHFLRSAGTTLLGFDELRTLICQISAIVNSRPLFPVSEDPADLNVLTPAHFLIGTSFSSFVEPGVIHLNYNRLDRWQRVTYLQQIFWKRWSEEYLTLLQQRSKWRTHKPGLQVNDVVLIKDENLPPLKWPLARVTELIRGRDNVARVAVLRTAVGTTRRAINKLCLLPLKDVESPDLSTGGVCREQHHPV